MFNQNKIKELRHRVCELETTVMLLQADNKELSKCEDQIKKLEKFLGVERREVFVPASQGRYLMPYNQVSVEWEYVRKETDRG
jgi:prefoldin subunit 5